MTHLPQPVLRLALLVLLGAATAPVPGAAQDRGLGELFSEARPLMDTRLRFERVELDSFERGARALTLRTRLGVESGRFEGFRVLIEGDLTRALGVDDFNSTVDGPSDRPVVADPDSERLNRLHLTWDGVEGWLAVVGRQRIIHDDARFIGNVGFRQNEQTYDAARLIVTPRPWMTLDYGYVW